MSKGGDVKSIKTFVGGEKRIVDSNYGC